jgi:hypothetical protein
MDKRRNAREKEKPKEASSHSELRIKPADKKNKQEKGRNSIREVKRECGFQKSVKGRFEK